MCATSFCVHRCSWLWLQRGYPTLMVLSSTQHTAEMDLSKTVPIESNARIVIFLKPYNELSILVKISKTTLINKWSKLRPKCRAYFIKATHRRNHSRVKLATRKMFAMMHLRKKKFSNFPDSGSGLYIFRILKFFWTLLWYGSFVVKYFLVIYFRAIGPNVLCAKVVTDDIFC